MQKYINRIARLEAQEALLAASIVAVGSGTAKNGADIYKEWERAASAGAPAGVRAKGRTWLDNLKALELMGIPVEITKAPGLKP